MSLTNHDFQWGRSEVVIIYPDDGITPIIVWLENMLLIVLYVLALSPILINIGNILLIMVNDDGYEMVNDGYKIKIIIWLVVEPTHLINMSSSVGMMTFPIYMEKYNMFQTTKQYLYNEVIPLYHIIPYYMG